MNAANADLWTLVLGIFTLLIVSSTIGYLLQRRLPAGQSNAAIENLNARIKAWWIMAILIGLAFLAGRIGVLGSAPLRAVASSRKPASASSTALPMTCPMWPVNSSA